MKPFLTLSSILLLFSCSDVKVNENAKVTEDVEVTDYLSVPGPLKFHDTDFNLVWSDHPTETYYLQEYLPEGDSLEYIKQMLTIHLFDSEIGLDDAVSMKVEELEERIKTDSECRYKVTKSPDGEEVNIEFFVGQKEGQELVVLEFNLYQYRQIMLDQDKKAMRIFAYTKRFYGDEIFESEKTWDEDRKTHFWAMNSLEKPAIKLNNE